ncbi:MAG TPA: 4-hydroxy-tetrahydrodipicolinate synthase [Acidobacteriaceae bacterium]|nr:4-hydroxy-tetrahydrodipicolinate synthase [Acidobacteriaceae bacterium]
MNLQGCGTAIITPFRLDGSLDEAALRSHVQWQIASGISLLVPCGTTGEAATLTESEWLRVVEITVQAANGRVPVFAGATHNSTREAVHRAQQAARIVGLTGILTANPYYNKPGQEGQYQHFKAIAQSVNLPIMLYNIPGRTGVNLEPATVLRLSEIPNIVAIKESSGNMVQITELLTQLPRAFRVFAGDDALALPTLAVGGMGLVSVASNAIPQQMAQMVHSALSDNWISARRINRHYFGLMQANFSEPNPAPIKAVMALLGRGNEQLRLPMVPVTPATRRKLERILGELGLLNAGPQENLRVF